MLLNKQPIEKRVTRADGRLDVHSISLTIQGEGPFCGTPCVFIRLAGCNLQCPACDTDYTSERSLMGPGEILASVNMLWRGHKWRPSGLVVITGGEPFRQDLSELFAWLNREGYYVQVETNGTLPPSDYFYTRDPYLRQGVYIVCSPKSGKVNPEVWRHACCAKYVIEDGNVNNADGLPTTALMHTANPHVARPPKGWGLPVYLQPMDAKDAVANHRNVVTARDSCLEHGHILQLQIHKIIGVE